MRPERSVVTLDEALSRNPALIKLAEMADQVAGIKLIAIMADKKGWKQVRIGELSQVPLFCRMIQGSCHGVRHCHTTHLLMMASAGSKGMNEHACHAGPRALVSPLANMAPNGSALISTCMFTSKSRVHAWKAAHARGLELGLDLKQLRIAFDALPALRKNQLQQARSILATAAEIMAEIKSRYTAEEKLAVRSAGRGTAEQLQAALVREESPNLLANQGAKSKSAPCIGEKVEPVLIRAVVSLIERKPEAPYSAAAIAAAARITPNHFSTLFHRWTGQRFLEFLTVRRVEAAQTWLRNLSLTIGEVANRAGFDDANYFSRRFKQATGLTPREWRNALPIAHRKNKA